MTPKEKANELYLKYKTLNLSTWTNSKDAKEMSLIAVDELIIEENRYNNGSFYQSRYWQEVKQEIEKL